MGYVPRVTIMYNAENDPCYKYDLGLIGDGDISPEQWTSARLEREVLFLEDKIGTRYKLSRESDTKGGILTYCFSRINISNGKEESLFRKLDWDNVEWGSSFVRVKGDDFPVDRMWFTEMYGLSQ